MTPCLKGGTCSKAHHFVVCQISWGYRFVTFQIGGFQKSQTLLDGPLVHDTVEILHQSIGSLSHYLQGFMHPRWCRSSSINSTSTICRTIHHSANGIKNLLKHLKIPDFIGQHVTGLGHLVYSSRLHGTPLKMIGWFTSKSPKKNGKKNHPNQTSMTLSSKCGKFPRLGPQNHEKYRF